MPELLLAVMPTDEWEGSAFPTGPFTSWRLSLHTAAAAKIIIEQAGKAQPFRSSGGIAARRYAFPRIDIAIAHNSNGI